MLSFKVHSFDIGGRHYLLLPKLNSAQMKILAERLERSGNSVHVSYVLSARSRGSTLKISPTGLCWSSVDPSDSILPVIPDLLSCPKQRVPLRELESLYMTRVGETPLRAVRLQVRLESSATWDALRASDECGLSPDERAVALTVIGGARGPCRMLTDFPGERSIPRIRGRRRFFESPLDFDEAKQTLREVGRRDSRNSFLPRDGILRSRSRISLPFGRIKQTLEELGEWCFLTPSAARKL